MNAICSFRKCTLSDEELLAKVDALTDEMYESYKIPDRHIPARPNDDYDLLVGELVLRFVELKSKEMKMTNETTEPTNDLLCRNCAFFKAIQMNEEEKIVIDNMEQVFGMCTNPDFNRYIFHKHAINGEFGCRFFKTAPERLSI